MTGHYVKGAARGSAPGRVVSVAVETREVPGPARRHRAKDQSFWRAYVWSSNRRNGRYSAPSAAVHLSVDSFWSHLERMAGARRKTTVFAPVASDALTLLGFFRRLDTRGCRWVGGTTVPESAGLHLCDDGGYTVRRMVMRGKPDIIEYGRHDHSYLWLSGRQYLDMAPTALRAMLGLPRPAHVSPDTDESDDEWTGRDLARLWLVAMTRLAEWWVPLRAGPWPRTVPAAAAAFLSSRVERKTLCTHKCPTAARLERDACHGGRASVWYYGHVCPRGRGDRTRDLPFPKSPYPPLRGPAVRLDVRSMYPSILRDGEFPVSKLFIRENIDVEELRVLLTHYSCVARVTVSAPHAWYPHRSSGRVLFPTGEFTTTLASPELLRAVSDGSVRFVHEVATYVRGRPYLRAASELIDMRDAAPGGRDGPFGTFVKLLANSMTGRLAMRGGQWVPRKDVYPREQWGEWLDGNTTDKTVTRFRARAGLVWELVRDPSGPGTLTAGYAHVTSYGRLMMRGIIERLPPRTVLQMDTDGLWVLRDRAGEALAGLIGGSALAGSLSVKESVKCLRFWTAKHYNADGRWVSAGLHDPSFSYRSASFSDSYQTNPVHTCPTVAPTTVTTHERSGHLDLMPADCIVGPDGWATPFRLPAVVGQKPDLPFDQGGGGGLFGDC